ncbi:MAG: hypothetical protein PHH84_03555 [Oscillospiraceae bacterium]|nr:hypothetical protein [Oscillospiraceae bacterium]MDD4413947.1 hypothetical protein [Oscillospiraceae bacterium]
MKKRFIALLVSVVMLFSFLGFTTSAEVDIGIPSSGVPSPYPDYAEGLSNSGNGDVSARAVGLINAYYIRLYLTDSNVITADVATSGTKVMALVGVKNFRVQRWVNDQWQTYISFNSLGKNKSTHSFSYDTPNLPSGYYYRFTGDHYVKEKGWFFPKSQTINNVTEYIYIA